MDLKEKEENIRIIGWKEKKKLNAGLERERLWWITSSNWYYIELNLFNWTFCYGFWNGGLILRKILSNTLEYPKG
jgi:hypothetical protein